MAEEHHNKSQEHEAKVGDEGAVETKDRGLFDFLGKKEEEKKPQEEVIATEFEKVRVSDVEPHVVKEEHKDEEKKHGLLEKLHRSGSSSSSVSILHIWISRSNIYCLLFEIGLILIINFQSSDEEEGEGEEKKKKDKKGLKEKIEEKISGEKEHEDTTVPVEKHEEAHVVTEAGHPEDKKGFLDKIKGKLPGQHKKAEEVPPPPPPPSAEYAATEAASHEGEAKEKKGFLDKIKEKLPGYHPKTEEEKEKEKESASAIP